MRKKWGCLSEDGALLSAHFIGACVKSAIQLFSFWGTYKVNKRFPNTLLNKHYSPENEVSKSYLSKWSENFPLALGKLVKISKGDLPAIWHVKAAKIHQP